MLSKGPRTWWSFVLRGMAAMFIGVLSVVWLRLSQAFLVILFGISFHQWLPDVFFRSIH